MSTFVFFAAVLAALYFIPALIALCGRKRNAGAIFALNLFAGWSVIGWVGALVWALCRDPAPPAAEQAAEPAAPYAPEPEDSAQGWDNGERKSVAAILIVAVLIGAGMFGADQLRQGREAAQAETDAAYTQSIYDRVEPSVRAEMAR